MRGQTPAEMLLKREIRTRLTLLEPHLKKVIEAKQDQVKAFHDGTHHVDRQIEDNDRGWVKMDEGSSRTEERITILPGKCGQRNETGSPGSPAKSSSRRCGGRNKKALIHLTWR